MSFSLRRWRPRHLLLAWSAYWIGLILVTLWPAFLAGWRLSGDGSHGSVNAGIGDQGLTATIRDSGNTVWTGSISLTSTVFLLCLPPLALWLVWLVTTSRAKNAEARIAADQMRQKELAGSDRTPGMNESFSKPSMRERREES